jgi:hypothetical protein
MQTMREKHFRNTEGATEVKTIKDEVATLKRGRRVTVELAPDEYLLSFKEDAYYRLGGQVEDVVQGHVITDSYQVSWCSIGQEWVS